MARILLADDDIELSGMLVDYFTAEGFDVDVAYDGEDGVATALADNYDAIIMDPPIFGHGPSGDTWKFSEHFPKLLKECQW